MGGATAGAMTDGPAPRYDRCMSEPLRIVAPTIAALGQYVDALRRGWSPNNEQPAQARIDQLDAIAKDGPAFIAAQVDREARGAPIKLPDGSMVARLPGYVLWIWDGEFCGTIGLRWQAGTHELPPTCLGHIGYSVVAWKRRHGYATAALALMLGHARAEGLEHVLITTNVDNLASQRVIQANGGIFVERVEKTAHHGGKAALRYRIDLGAIAPKALGA